jgi:hypothetical protein
MLKANSLLFETAVLPELTGRLKGLEDKAAKGFLCLEALAAKQKRKQFI